MSLAVLFSFVSFRLCICGENAATTLGGKEYVVGTPIDVPVALTYFESNDLKMVDESYEHYDHLLDHVANQLDSEDLSLFRTPVVLTLQGDIDDDDNDGEEEEYDLQGNINLERDAGQDTTQNLSSTDAPHPSLRELLQRERYFDPNESDPTDDDFVNDDGDDDDGNDDYDDSFSAADLPGVEVQPIRADMADVSADLFVTDEDSRNLRRAHRKADRILDHAEDVRLIGTFLYQKRVFHLVRLMEPLLFIARRATTVDGSFYFLLDDEDSHHVRSMLESLLLHGDNDQGEHHPSSQIDEAKQRKPVAKSHGKRPKKGFRTIKPPISTSRRSGKQPLHGVQAYSHRSGPR